LIFVGTNGTVSCFHMASVFLPDLPGESVDQSLPIQWSRSLVESKLAQKQHTISVCLDFSKPVIYTAYDGTIFALHCQDGEIIWKVSPPSVGGILCWFTSICHTSLHTEKLFVGRSGYVVCLDTYTGDQLWEVNLKGTGYGCVNLLSFTSDLLVAGTNGYVFGLDPEKGTILWYNNLSGTGFGLVTLAKYTFADHESCTGDSLLVGNNGFIVSINPKDGQTKLSTPLESSAYRPTALFVDQQHKQIYAICWGEAHAISLAATHKEVWRNSLKGLNYTPASLLTFKECLFLGQYGKVTCIHQVTGETLWTVSLPGCGYNNVSLLLYDDKILAGSFGKFYQLHPEKGELELRDTLKGFGFQNITFACYSPLGMTNFNSTIVVLT